ncbi:MAG: hypothetical protein QNM02_01910, partial [Acidimicrobiia bacterium]|nr:hypothetical protein [Acidimicrobiia bacterium]
ALTGHRILPPYTEVVEPTPAIEDERGVDTSQIEHQLRLSVPERVREMVHAANVLIAIREHARPLSSAEE